MSGADPDFETALRGLSEPDHVRLQLAAKFHARKLRGVPPEWWVQLLNEAMQRALDGRRRWPGPGVPVPTFLSQTMRSIVSAEAKAAAGKPLVLQAGDASASAAAAGGPVLDQREAPGPGPAEQAADGDAIAALRAALTPDDLALQVLDGHLERMPVGDVCTALGMSQREYADTWKRVVQAGKRILLDGSAR